MQFSNEQQEYIDKWYLALPVDADGVPIRPGDKIQFGTNAPVRVYSIGTSRCDCGDFGWFGSDGGFYGMGTLRSCRHVKPDTVESLLEEFFGIANLPSEDELRSRREIIADYAERIRKVMRGTECNRLTEERDRLRAEVKKLGEQLDRLRNDGGLA